MLQKHVLGGFDLIREIIEDIPDVTVKQRHKTSTAKGREDCFCDLFVQYFVHHSAFLSLQTGMEQGRATTITFINMF